MSTTNRQYDRNGYMQVRDNPLSKVGVFPYLGREIAGHELPPDQVFNVFRPAEELQRLETIESFKLMPFIDEHQVLGEGGTPAEQKGIQGYIGENVYFDAPYLRGNIMVPSQAAQTLIKNGKTELSPAYRCLYEKKDGSFDGQPYQFIQRDILANHLALVKEGRTGPDVAVLDHRTITIDSKRLTPMEFTPEQLAQIKALFLEMMAEQSALDADADPTPDPANPAAKDADPVEVVEPVVSAEQAAAAEETLAVAEEASVALEAATVALAAVEAAAEEVATAPTADSKAKLAKAKGDLKVAQDSLAKVNAKRKPTMDGLRAEIARVAKLAEKPATQVMTADAMIAMVADRDALAAKASKFIGTFDYSRMTADGVAKYACEKVGLKPAAGSERIALDAWMHGRKSDAETVVQDRRVAVGDSVDNLWEQK